MIKTKTAKDIQKKAKALSVEKQVYEIFVNNKCTAYQASAYLVIVLKSVINKITEDLLKTIMDKPNAEASVALDKFQALAEAIEEFIGEKKCK